MPILIGDEYQIDADNLNIIISEKKIPESGKNKDLPYRKPFAYYANLREALHAMVNLEVRKSQLKDVYTVIKRLDALEAHIDSALNKLLTQQIKTKKEE